MFCDYLVITVCDYPLKVMPNHKTSFINHHKSVRNSVVNHIVRKTLGDYWRKTHNCFKQCVLDLQEEFT